MSYYDANRFWDGLLATNFSLQGVGHGGYGPRYNEYLYRAKTRTFFTALRKTHISIRNKSVLDVGCGIGFFAAIYKRFLCRSYAAFDIAPTAVTRMRQRYPQDFIEQVDIGSQLDLSIYKAGPFDIVHCFDVIYHIIDPAKYRTAVDNLWSLVKPGGHLLLVDSFWREDLIPGGTLEFEVDPKNVPHVCFHKHDDYNKLLFSRDDCEVLGYFPMYFLFNRPIVGNTFPWTHEKISWHLRYNLCEMAPTLILMLAADNLLVRAVQSNPSLKVAVMRKRLN